MATAVGVALQPCNFTRGELMKALADSGYGANVGAYKAFFRSTSDGTHLCSTCGLPPGHHGAGEAPAAAVGGDASATTMMTLLHPSATVSDVVLSSIKAKNTAVPRPAHWVSAYSFAPLLQFSGVTSVVTGGTAKHPTQQGRVKWRCMVEDASGAVCGEMITTAGIHMRGGVPIAGTTVDLGHVRGVGENNNDDDDEGPVVAHMRTAHGLELLRAGRWTERFCGFCDDPRAAATVCCPVPDFNMGAGCPQTCPPDEGRGVCCANCRVTASAVAQSAIIQAAPLDRAQCGCSNCGALIFLPMIMHMALLSVLVLVGSILTMCGFPCNSDSLPPLICCCCFQNRRRMVKVLGADESNCESRCKVLFCCPCSETQVWREVRGSGVWPGLLCCTANDEDKQIMAAAAVRRRYQLADGQAAGVVSKGTRGADMALMRLLEAAPPKIGYAME